MTQLYLRMHILLTMVCIFLFILTITHFLLNRVERDIDASVEDVDSKNFSDESCKYYFATLFYHHSVFQLLLSTSGFGSSHSLYVARNTCSLHHNSFYVTKTTYTRREYNLYHAKR